MILVHKSAYEQVTNNTLIENVLEKSIERKKNIVIFIPGIKFLSHSPVFLRLKLNNNFSGNGGLAVIIKAKVERLSEL